MTDERMQALFNLDVTKKFILELFKFVASFANLEERLKAEMAAKDQSACFKTTMEICAGLKRIYAGDLADEFYQTMQHLKTKEFEEIEMYLADFLVYVAMLSIDIQMALFKHDSAKVSLQTPPPEASIASKLKQEKELIIAVDNTMMFLITLRTYLKDTALVLECTTILDDVFKLFNKRRPSLIILGVDLPKMDTDGFELAEKIRALGHDAPIVFITGNASEKNVMRAMEMGAAGFIVKPASQNSILKIIEKLIGLPPKPQPAEAPKKQKEKKLPNLPDLPELRDLPKK